MEKDIESPLVPVVLIMKKSFETYLSFIENELGVQLLCWQKTALRAIYDGYYPHISNIRNGKVMMYQATKLLSEEMNRDVGILPPRLYEIDGYTVDVVTYDENWGENIEWEKENKL